MLRSNKTPQVIVLSAGPNGLGVVRGLWLRGVKAGVIGYQPGEPVMYSRLPVFKQVLTAANPKDKIEQLTRMLEPYHSQDVVLIATSDWFISFLDDHRDHLSKFFRFVIPDRGLTDLFIDKTSEAKAVGKAVPVPKTLCELPDSAEGLLGALRLPIIIKPRSHRHMVLGKKNIQLYDNDQVIEFYDKFGHTLESVIAQEIIEGPDSNLWVCNCSFNRRHELIGAFIFRRLRLSPPHYGVTSYALSESNQKVFDLVAKLGKELEYSGPAMVEFKYDPRDDDYKFIELNPRLGLINYFDTRCGINNVYATYRLSGDGNWRPASIPRQKDGKIFLSFYEDFYSRRTDGESIGGIIKDYLSDFLKPHIFIYFAWIDPSPAFGMAWVHSRQILQSIRRKVFRAHSSVPRRGAKNS